MTKRLSILIGLTCLLPLSCQEEKKPKAKVEPAKEAKKEEPAKPEKKPLINIPAGAVITDLTLPYFDEDKKPISLMTVKELSVDNEVEVDGETILNGKTLKLWLFDKNEAISTITTIPEATYLMERELIEAEGEILTRDTADRFAAKSSGGIFALPTGQALLFGPATTRFNLPEKKKKSVTMNLRPLLPAAMVSQTLIAAPPTITPEQLADFERKVAPRMLPDIDGRENFAKAQPLEQQITNRFTGFLKSVDQTVLISENTPTEAAPEEEDPLKDLFKPGPESIVIKCSKGIYLDGENREIVYLGDIKIEGQGMTMTCKRDLKAIFNEPPAPPEDEKKEPAETDTPEVEKNEPAKDDPEKEQPKEPAKDASGDNNEKAPGKDDKKEEKDKNPLSRFGGFGDLKQFTATGDVRLSGVNEEGQKIYLGGDRALYEMVRKGEQVNSTVTMRGDKIGFKLVTPKDPKDPKKKGNTVAFRSTSPNCWIVAEIQGDKIRLRTSDDGWLTVLKTEE